MSGIIETTNLQTANIKSTTGNTAITVAANGTATFSNPPSGLGTINYVNGLTVSGSTTTAFNTIFTGTALNGGCKTLKIFLTGISNESNGYLGFRTINSDDATNDGGYNSSFIYRTGTTFNQNSGNGDGNLAYQLVFAYYAGLYDVCIEGILVDPSVNRWAFQCTANSISSSTATSGQTLGHNDLGANKPLKGFRLESTNSNGIGVGTLKYAYSYTV